MSSADDSRVSQSEMGFLHDLKRGEEGEDLIIQKLQEIYGGVAVKSGGAKGWDFSLSKKGKTVHYEAKTDFYSQKTNRIFLETSCSGKPSGIFTTTADFWVYYLPHAEVLFKFCPKEMISLINSTAGSKLKKVSGGDSKRASGVLIDVATLEGLSFVTKIDVSLSF